MDNDCPICQVDLEVPAFLGTEEDSEISETLFRLKCGHAFHTACLCRALRTNQACPVCRDGKESLLNLQLSPDGTFVLVEDTDVASENFDEEEARIANEVLEHINREPQVQHARLSVNRGMREYRKMEASLMKKRKSIIDKALRSFRSEYKTRYDEERQKLKAKLQRLRQTELAEAEKYAPGSAERLRNVVSYNVADIMSNKDSFGPLKYRFWYR